MSQPTEVLGSTPVLGSYPPIPRTVVKSAGRVLKIFEFFDDIRRPATAREICATLAYPQSSVSMLLRSMEAMGYLQYDRVHRTYLPSHRLALSGAWLRGPLVGKGPLQTAMEDLHQLTGHAVLLNQRHGLHGRYIHVVQASLTVGHVVVGTQRPLTATGSGHTLLSVLPNSAVRRAVLAINARHRVGQPPLNPAEVLRAVARIREEGYFIAASLSIQGAASVSVLLPGIGMEEPMALAILGRADAIAADKQALIHALRNAVARVQEACAGAD